MAKKDPRVYIKKNNSTITGGSANLPQPSTMEYGELAVNYHKGVETLTFKNDANEMVKLEPLNVVQSTGSSTKDVMSQDAVTKELNKKANSSDIYNKGDVYTKSECDGKFLTINTAETNYLTKSDASSTYTTKSYADSTYATIASIPTKVSQLTNDRGYQTSSQVESAITSKGYITTTAADGKYQLKGDYLTKSEASSTYATITTVNGKQDNLVSGTNIKTINNESLLGSGNITIETGTGGIPDANKDGKTYGRNNGAWVEITSPDLSGYLTTATAASTYATKKELGTKQDTLVSGTNIKTINGNTILGNGNIEITTGTGGISDAPSDGSLYARKNGNWASFSIPDVSNFLTKSEASSTYVTDSELSSKGYLTSGDFKTINNQTIIGSGNIEITTGTGGISDAPTDGKLYGRKSGSWSSITIPIANYSDIDILNDFGGVSIWNDTLQHGCPIDSNGHPLILKVTNRMGVTREINTDEATISIVGEGSLNTNSTSHSMWCKQSSTQFSHVQGFTITIPNATTSQEGFMSASDKTKLDNTVGQKDGLGEIFNSYDGSLKNSATPQYAHAEGSTTSAEGVASHAEGDQTVASGGGAHAEGFKSTAAGLYAHAEGNGTTAGNEGAHAEGLGTNASGSESHAEGNGTTASGNYSHAEGNGTTAGNDGAHAEGYGCIASGQNSHAEGAHTTAYGTCSHAAGLNTIAIASLQYVIGQYNTTESGEGPNGNRPLDRAFIIGNGHDSAPGNAFYVRLNGETHADGAYSGGGADYAEMFEWSDGNPNDEDRIGKFVTLDGDKIRLANGSDSYVLGIVSGAPMVIGNNPMRWQGKYLNDEWGRPIYENVENDVEVPMTPDDEGYDPNSKEPQMKTVKRTDYVRKLNPDWKGEQEYSLRTDRKEWDCIGLLGKLLVVQDGTLKVGGFCKVGDNGIATASDSGYYVMKVNSDSQALIMFVTGVH